MFCTGLSIKDFFRFCARPTGSEVYIYIVSPRENISFLPTEADRNGVEMSGKWVHSSGPLS